MLTIRNRPFNYLDDFNSLIDNIFDDTQILSPDIPTIPEISMLENDHINYSVDTFNFEKMKILFIILDSCIFLHKACSLPPLPINPIFMTEYILYNL